MGVIFNRIGGVESLFVKGEGILYGLLGVFVDGIRKLFYGFLLGLELC